jgi:hypothetical protein
VKQRRRRTLIPVATFLAVAVATVLSGSAAAQGKPVFGKLAGVVRDTAGTAQLGATVQVVSEISTIARPEEYLTNTQGLFHAERLAPGFYTIRVTLAGFLPTLQQHVRITANLTTVLRIELESMLVALDQLRRRPPITSDGDDWKWVLRSSVAMRPVLQWMGQDDADSSADLESNASPQSRGRLELTSGARHPGSISNLADAAGSAFAYEQKVGDIGRLLIAGQGSYERAPAGGFASIWLPTGSMESGPRTTLVVREAKQGMQGPTFRGLRMDQSGDLGIGQRMLLHYGAEYVFVGLRRSASSLRPRAELEIRLSDAWSTLFEIAAQPSAPPIADPEGYGQDRMLGAAINQLDTLPALLWRNGQPVLESGWHGEFAARRKLGDRGSLQFAIFHDDDHHAAVYGMGRELAGADFIGDFFSHGFATDGGSFSAWGGRVVLQEKISETVDVNVIYSVASALGPESVAGELPIEDLRDALRARQRQALSANVKARISRTGTRFRAGYKWINGEALTRVDGYAETLFQDDPYLHISVRQALPKWGMGRWEALAECQNLLAQGYLPVSGHDGSVMLIPAFRSFRGGLSFQF